MVTLNLYSAGRLHPESDQTGKSREESDSVVGDNKTPQGFPKEIGLNKVNIQRLASAGAGRTRTCNGTGDIDGQGDQDRGGLVTKERLASHVVQRGEWERNLT